MLGSFDPFRSPNRRSLIDSSYLRRSSQSLHKEDHVPAEQVDDGWKDLEAGGGNHKQGDRRACREMAI